MRVGQRRQRRYGLIGAGRFGSFWLETFKACDSLCPVAVTDRLPEAADAVSLRFGLASCRTTEDLLARRDLDLVVISTPPSTHYDLALQSLRAGKHVICEKPLATSTEQADALLAAARERGLLLAADHMLRYSGLLEIVARVVKSRLLGEPFHFLLENYAKDEDLPENHWFWDRSLSGGIFIEHAVHFFDLQRWWFGPGEVIAAHAENRPGTARVDQVWCALRHEGGILGHQYHSFTQPTRLDRADHRILFDRGDLVVRGWIPLDVEITGILNEEQQEHLSALCGQCDYELLERYEAGAQHCRGRGKDYVVTARVSLRRRLPAEARAAIYGDMMVALVEDQLRSLDDPRHRPRLTAEDARSAVAMAEQATRRAGER